MNNNKVINSRCVCGSGLTWIDKTTIMLDPCEHIVHRSCCPELKQLESFSDQGRNIRSCSNIKCPICKQKVTIYYTEEELKILSKIKPRYYQKYVDILSVKNLNNICTKNINKFVLNLPYILDIISRIPFTRGFDAGHKLVEDTLTVANVKLTIIGKKNIIPGNKIIISNHVSVMDFLIMFFVFKCGFLASSSIKDTWLGKLAADVVPLLFIERGKESNTVERMKDYIKERGSLCLFPEGMMVHPDTLIRFRSGAFHVGEPIIPTIINYNPVVTDINITEFIQKLASHDVINVTVKILPAEYPPFNDEKIEQIRQKMAKTGNLALSRVSNRDIKDGQSKQN